MPNRNYVRGRAFEHRVKRELEQNGWLVIRAAGSKGPFDLIAVNKYLTFGIQCKADGKISRAEIEKMLQAAKDKAIIPALALRSGRKIEWRLIESE